MKVLIVSDTHGQDENLEETVLREAPFDYLIHCGDVEGREIFIEALAECPCTIVAGNNDFFTGRPGCKKRDAAPSKTEKVLHLVFIWGKGKNGRQKDHSAHRPPRIWMKSG
jgi:putative phosphoesterase